MAITFEKRRRHINFFAIGVVLFGFGFLALAAYYLFFAPSPKFEAIAVPSGLKRAEGILESGIKFIDPKVVLENERFRDLSRYDSELGRGALGRENPFLDFAPPKR